MASKLLRKNIFYKLICFLLPVLFVPTDITFGQTTGNVPSADLAEVKDKKNPTPEEDAEEENDDDDDC